MENEQTQAHKAPFDANAEEGDVVIDCPGGLAYSMTPEAAAATSDRLADAADAAQGQRKDTAEEAEAGAHPS